MLMANSAAILTDAFPAEQRGMALGVNQISALSGQFIGLVLGGAARRSGTGARCSGSTCRSASSAPSGRTAPARDRPRASRPASTGGATSPSPRGCALLLVAITYGIQPYGGHTMGWTNPLVLAGLIARRRAAGRVRGRSRRGCRSRCSSSALFRNRAFAAGNAAALLASVARGGLQFMLIIWLQGIWLPLHGYDYADTPLWAGIFLLPLTAGFLLAGPISGYLSDRFGVRLLHHRRAAAVRRQLRRPAAAAGQLPVLGVRAADHAQRHRLRDVLRAEHLGDHEQRARAPPRRRVRDAVDLPELRHVAVDRHLLLAADHRPGRAAARRAGSPDCAARACRRRSPTTRPHCRRSPRCSRRSSASNPIADAARADRRAATRCPPHNVATY